MVGGLSLREVELMPVPSLLDRLASIRRIDARRRLDALHERAAAARGTPEGVHEIEVQLAQAGGRNLKSMGVGDVNDFTRWLGGT